MSRPKKLTSYWNQREGSNVRIIWTGEHVVKDIALRDDFVGNNPDKHCWVLCECGATLYAPDSEGIERVFADHVKDNK